MANVLMRARQALMAQSQHIQLRVDCELAVGPGRLYDAASYLREQQVRCVMVVTSPGFVRRGLIRSFANDLLTHGITSAVFSNVKPDPDIECVQEAAAFYRSHGCEAIVAIGGGSVMDCAKVAGALVARPNKEVADLMGMQRVGRSIPYLIAVPTTAGTGSEATAAAVVTDPVRQRKYAIGDLALIPDVAILDPSLLCGLPPAMTAYSGMDALTHAVEAYINRFGAHQARAYAKEAVTLIFANLKKSYDDGGDMTSRKNMLIASYKAGIAFSNAMVGYVHALAHGIGGRYHVQHGLANAVLLPIVLEEFGESAEGRLADLAQAIGLHGSDDYDLARQFIAKIRELNASMGIPATIAELQAEDIPELAAGAQAEGNPAYPVPEIWNLRRFERVLKRALPAQDAPVATFAHAPAHAFSTTAAHASSTAAAHASSTAAAQTRLTKEGPLLDGRGMLTTPGFATSQVLRYDRARVKASPLRIKEWDYYLVNDDECALALTIGDMGYAALVSASVIDFTTNDFTTSSTLGVLPLGRLGLPPSSREGATSFADKRVKMRFDVAGGMRYLHVEFADFRDGQALSAEVVLDEEPRDSMVIATPWIEDDLAFYYNQKILAMRAIGVMQIGGKHHVFAGENSFGLLDWGRGVWTRDNTWYWSAAQGIQGGRRFGFNLGYGFGDTSAASENMLFVDGVAHKLGRVDFGIPVRDASAANVGERFDLMQPWHMTDDASRLDLHFTPDIDRCDFMDFKAIVSDQHQVFGRFDGRVVLDDGSELEVSDLRGFAEAVHNMY